MNRLSIVFVFLFFSQSLVNAQIAVSTNSNTNFLVNQFLGSGMTLSGSPIKYCHGNGTGTFTNGHSTSCPLDSGIILSTGYASFLDRTATYTASAGLNYGFNDADLLSLSPHSNTDICYLQFNFIPDNDSLVFEYVFGSEEYLEWVGSVFNDVFGFFVTGPNPAGGTYNKLNLATVPTTASIVSINSINDITNSAYYINNYPTGTVPGINDPYFTLDGFTTKMEIGLAVVPLSTYTIKMVIGDVSDPLWDSYVLLHNKSFRSVASGGSLPIDLLSFKGTAIDNGIRLTWETAQEENHSAFEIEYSYDGVYWEKIGDVDGAINSNSTKHYSFLHAPIKHRWNYYRLKLIDLFGGAEYSKTVAVESNTTEPVFNVYPSIVSNGELIVQSSASAIHNLKLSIYNTLGQQLISKNISSLNSKIDVTALKNGAYIAILESPSVHKTFRFVIQQN